MNVMIVTLESAIVFVFSPTPTRHSEARIPAIEIDNSCLRPIRSMRMIGAKVMSTFTTVMPKET